MVSHPTVLGTIKKHMDTCIFMKFVRVDYLKILKSINLATKCNWSGNSMIYNLDGDPSHITAQSLLKDFDRTLNGQLPVLPKVDNLCVVSLRTMLDVLTNKIQQACSSLAHLFLSCDVSQILMALRDGVMQMPSVIGHDQTGFSAVSRAGEKRHFHH